MTRFRWTVQGRWLAASLLVATLATSGSAGAQERDPAAARAQLMEGYDLRAQGKFAEAYPHLVESLRLDPQVKTLLNLADCEEHLGKLAEAQRHWVQARDLAVPGSAEKQGATARLAALDKRMPRLTLRLDAGAPPGSRVTRDGVLLGAVSLDTPLPLDPGAHRVVVRAAGYEERSYDVAVSEAETKEIDVAPGGKIELAEPPRAPEGAAGPAASATASGPWRTIGLVTAGVGAVGLGVGAVYGVQALQKKNDADAAGCSGTQCPPGAVASRNAAQSAGDASTIFFVAGAALAAGGATMWLFAPNATPSIQAAPSVGQDGAGVTVRGSF
jgi:PEGA domain